MRVTPGEATYVIDRLINERRLSTTDIQHYLHDLQREITTTAERLATLRAIAPPNANAIAPNTLASNTIGTNTSARNTVASNTTRRKRRSSPVIRAQQQVQGRYAGYLRQVAAHAKPRFQLIKARDGITAAITALKQHLGK